MATATLFYGYLLPPDAPSLREGHGDAQTVASQRVQLFWHGCGSTIPLPFLAIDESRKIARSGIAQVIYPATQLVVGGDWYERLTASWQALGVPPVGGPDWYLVCTER